MTAHAIPPILAHDSSSITDRDARETAVIGLYVERLVRDECERYGWNFDDLNKVQQAALRTEQRNALLDMAITPDAESPWVEHCRRVGRGEL